MFKVFRCNGFPILIMVSKIMLEKIMYFSFSWLSDEAYLCM